MSNSSILPGGQRVERTRTGKQRRLRVAASRSPPRAAPRSSVSRSIIGIVLLQVIDDGTSGPDR